MWIYDLKYWWRKRRKRILIWFSFFFILFLFRFQILSFAGNILINEDPLTPTDAVFVLGGNSKDRAKEASVLYQKEISKTFICTGSYESEFLQFYNIPHTEAAFSASLMKKHGVPTQNVISLVAGTSTREEADTLLNYSLKNGYKSVTVVSDKFHTRRIGQVFYKKFREKGIEVYVHGVSHSNYDEERYWEAEQGLLMVFEEYVKMVYYWIT